VVLAVELDVPEELVASVAGPPSLVVELPTGDVGVDVVSAAVLTEMVEVTWVPGPVLAVLTVLVELVELV
jgi:hypothetical protein